MALRKAEDRIAELVREVDSVENDARLWHESEGERKRLQKGRDTSWFMYLDSLEGERLVLAERVSALEARLAAEGEEEPPKRYGCSQCGKDYTHPPVTFSVPGFPTRTYYFCSAECRHDWGTRVPPVASPASPEGE